MSQFSIVIVAKNAEDKIGRLLSSIEGLSDDVVLVDTGSTDATVTIAEKTGIKVHHLPWKGYGKSNDPYWSYAIGFLVALIFILIGKTYKLYMCKNTINEDKVLLVCSILHFAK